MEVVRSSIRKKWLFVMIPRTEQYKKIVYYIGSRLWNELNEYTRSIDSLSDFKKKINAL